jgi:O-antigen/teichoic acid export membrane protein
MALVAQSGVVGCAPARTPTRQLLINSAGMVMARAAGLLTLVISVPVIVGRLGPVGFGVWDAMLAIAGITMIFQTVVSGTVLWRISANYGTQDFAETRRLVRVGIGATLGLLFALLPIVFGFRDEILLTLQVPADSLTQARSLLPAITGLLLIGGVNESLAAVLIGYQRAGKASLVQSVGLAVANLVSIAILMLGGGLESLLIGSIAGFAVTLVVLYSMASSICGKISLMPLLPRRSDIAVIGPFFALLFISNLTLIFRDHTDKIVLASMASPATVGFFGMSQRLAMAVAQVCAVFIVPFTSAVGALHAAGDREGIRQLYEKVATWLAALVGLMTVILCTLHEPLFVLWLGESRPEAYPFLAILLFGSGSAIILAGAGVALTKGVGRPGLETSYAIITLALTLILKPLLVHEFDAIGAVAASAASWCLGAFAFLILFHRREKLTRGVSYRLLGIWLVTIILSGLGWSSATAMPSTRGASDACATLVLGAPLAAATFLGSLWSLRLLSRSKSPSPI